MCGINVAGENSFVVSPLPGGSFTHAEAKYNSIYGMVESSWERRDGKTVYTITIPANCTAEIRLPEGMSQTVGAGTYTFEEQK